MDVVTYGAGGFDPQKPAANVVDTQVVAVAPEVVNADSLRGKAQQALTANAAFLALGAPTNVQVVAQVQRLTRECNALIRLLLGQLDDTSGT